MAVVTISAKTVNDITSAMDPLRNGFSHDSRFKAWAKAIGKRSDLDLAAVNGYAIKSAFTNWGTSVALAPGQFVVLASETGSRARHDYQYALVGIDADDHPFVVDDATIAADLADATIPDAVRAKAANSKLYRIALYVARRFDAAAEAARTEERAPMTDQEFSIWCRMVKHMTPAQRATLAAELTA